MVNIINTDDIDSSTIVFLADNAEHFLTVGTTLGTTSTSNVFNGADVDNSKVVIAGNVYAGGN